MRVDGHGVREESGIVQVDLYHEEYDVIQINFGHKMNNYVYLSGTLRSQGVPEDVLMEARCKAIEHLRNNGYNVTLKAEHDGNPIAQLEEEDQ